MTLWVVTGIDPSQPLAMRKARMAVYERLLGELDANNQHLSEQISEIDLTDPQDARVLMPEQGTDILGHFGDDRFLERYQRYKAHIAEWRQQYPKLAAVDLRYESQVVLEMTPGTNAVAAAVGDSASTAGPDAKAAVGPAKPSAGKTIADASTTQTAASKPVSMKPDATKPEASVEEAAAANPPIPGVKQAPEKQSPVSQTAAIGPKKSTQKAVSVEALAAKQRAARARAAKLRAAHEKALREKKRAAAQRTALNTKKSSTSTHAATAAAQGQ